MKSARISEGNKKSHREISRDDKLRFKKLNYKFPKPKKIYSPDNGKTVFFAKDDEHFEILKKKHPKKDRFF